MERGLLIGFFPKSFLKIDRLLLPESNRLLMEGALSIGFPPSLRPLLGLAGRSLCTGEVSTDWDICKFVMVVYECVCVCKREREGGEACVCVCVCV